MLEEGLKKLNTVLESLEPLHKPLEPPGGSVLLRELASVAHVPDATLSPTATPLLHALSSAHAYITMFVHVCKMGQVRHSSSLVLLLSSSDYRFKLFTEFFILVQENVYHLVDYYEFIIQSYLDLLGLCFVILNFFR